MYRQEVRGGELMQKRTTAALVAIAAATGMVLGSQRVGLGRASDTGSAQGEMSGLRKHGISCDVAKAYGPLRWVSGTTAVFENTNGSLVWIDVEDCRYFLVLSRTP
jgi:hypothetical protein